MGIGRQDLSQPEAIHNYRSQKAHMSSSFSRKVPDFQRIIWGMGIDNDHCGVGFLHLFNPSSTTFVKHFICNNSAISHDDYNQNNFVAGYGNTTSAVDAIQFKMSSGNIDAGDICLYGIL